MANDIVIVPTYYRPEYLHLCLQSILNAEGGAEKEIWVGHDNKQGNGSRSDLLNEAEQVVGSFVGKFRAIRFIMPPLHSYTGNVCNFLELYKAAYESDARYVYLIEDDVHVAPDFFRWHEAVQAHADYLCSVAWHCIRNPHALKTGDVTAIIESTCDYSSIGVCWKREKLADIVQHARPEYYQNLSAYLARAFLNSPIPYGQWTEQAGLIMRTLIKSADGHTVAWAVVARCFHIGVHGYHRPSGHQFTGNLEQRIKLLDWALRTELPTANKFDDINLPQPIPDWKAEDLHVIQSFKWDGRL